ncbi:hypothetical protein Vretimale_8337 [Volvox reticuliferus]|uniref:Uncharacterized protein n=1 Tax=Volvox reticuliferus TaxID=1737510 RepID=A0A8J4GB00_9CHLO|nr:hypothetical protein Vretifemale_11712 [Volvox reticuliferus]GIM03610.1 hypothetical protein Vretimale_8337 [Volvox reticuliferus]
MTVACCLGRRVNKCPSWRPLRRRERVVLCASHGEETRPEIPISASSSSAERFSELPSYNQGWRPGAEATVPGPSNRVVQVLKANRSVKLIRSEGRRLGQRRLAAFASAVALTALAWYGQDLILELGQRTSLPVEELAGLIYFIICFNVVSLVLPKSRYRK